MNGTNITKKKSLRRSHSVQHGHGHALGSVFQGRDFWYGDVYSEGGVVELDFLASRLVTQDPNTSHERLPIP